MLHTPLSKSALPVGAAVAAGSLLLVGATATGAQAATVATSGDTPSAPLDEQPVPGQVASTQSDTETVTVHETRSVTTHATKRLTSRVKATAKATATAHRSSTRTVTVTVTRYAPTADDAAAEAEQVAHDAAHAQAEAEAGKSAAATAHDAAHASARKKARTRADHLAHRTFENRVVHRAASLKGRPYRWGGNGPGSFDCSGYVRYVLKKEGVNHLPRTSSGISGHVHHASKHHKHRGDLIFFRSGGHVYHVAIYAGHGKIWHAPGSGRSVTEAKIWTSSYIVGRAV